MPSDVLHAHNPDEAELTLLATKRHISVNDVGTFTEFSADPITT